jgi:hypothetical protein
MRETPGERTAAGQPGLARLPWQARMFLRLSRRQLPAPVASPLPSDQGSRPRPSPAGSVPYPSMCGRDAIGSLTPLKAAARAGSSQAYEGGAKCR